MTRRSPCLPRCIVALLGLPWLVGCESAPEVRGAHRAMDESKAVAQEGLNEDELRQQLYVFSDDFAASVAGAADTIASSTTDRRIQKLTLRWKMRLIPTMQRVILIADPRHALVDAWMICLRMEDLFKKGDATELFSEQQPVAIATSERLLAHIEKIAQRLLPADRFVEVKKSAQEHASEIPIAGDFVAEAVRASAEAAESGSAFHWSSVLNYPMKPLTGLSDTASAVVDMKAVTAAFILVARSLPERARWQSELLLLEIDSLESITTMRQDFTRISESFREISETTAALPAELRKELDAGLEAAEGPQGKLLETVQLARETVAELNQTMSQAQEVATLVDTTTVNLSKAAEAWDATARTVNDVMQTIQALSDEPSTAAAEDERPFDIRDYEHTADRVREAAVEVRGLLGDLESPREATTEPTALSIAGERAQSSIDHAKAQASGLIKLGTVCGLILIAAATLAGLLYRAITVRYLRPGS